MNRENVESFEAPLVLFVSQFSILAAVLPVITAKKCFFFPSVLQQKLVSYNCSL